MKLAWKEGHHLVMGLMAEDDQERATLEAFRERADKVRIENRTSLFRDHELIIYLPMKQHPQHVINKEGAAHD